MSRPYSPIDFAEPRVMELFDELPLWSAPFGHLLLDRVPMMRRGTILDVGAGTGFIALELAQRCGSGVQVIAVDPWSAACERLRSKIALLELPNVRVVESTVEDLDPTEVSEGAVDLVVCNLGLNNFERPVAALERCRKLAVTGATLALTSNLVGHMDELYEELCEVLIAEGLSACLPSLEAHRQHRGTLKSISRLLESADFEVVDAVTDSFRLRYVDGTSFLRHYFIRLGFLGGWSALVPESEIQEVFSALEGRLNRRAAEAGELVMTIPLVYVEARAKEAELPS